jgi:hypothetical protein
MCVAKSFTLLSGPASEMLQDRASCKRPRFGKSSFEREEQTFSFDDMFSAFDREETFPTISWDLAFPTHERAISAFSTSSNRSTVSVCSDDEDDEFVSPPTRKRNISPNTGMLRSKSIKADLSILDPSQPMH